jgi:hypothetical protein
MMRSKIALTLLASALATSAFACSTEQADDSGQEDDLTSNTALARDLSFQGKVYVRKGASDSEITSAVRAQTQTGFGALRTINISVNSRELKGVDPSTFKKRDVTVIDPSKSLDNGTAMTEVLYTYKDNAVVAKSYARKTSVPLAVMNPSYRNQTQRILTECTKNDSEAQEFSGQIWYVFEPSVSQCKTAMKAEQDKVTADRAKLKKPNDQVTQSEVDRLYIPVTARLGADKTNKGNSYPEYDRLYAGGVEPGKLVVGLVYGMIDHERSGGPETDYNFSEYMSTIREIMTELPQLKITSVEGGGDLSSVKLASGKTVPLKLADIVALTDWGGGPANLTSAERDEVKKLVGQALYLHWVTMEAPVSVKVGDQPEKQSTVKIIGYFGAESGSAPHKYGIKNSDVFLYNGHSYIGYGPLDPSNFTAADFPKSYQILFIDGCVSYNYYEADYIPLKDGGTKNLDLITNGIEAPSYRSGYALGRFVATLVNGKQASYRDLLSAASATDPLRVVDGENDNKYDPARTPITIRK